MLAKVVSKRKLLCYDDKSLKLVYLIMLNVFPYKVQIITDVRTMKAEPLAACLVQIVCVKDERFIHDSRAEKARGKTNLLASQLAGDRLSYKTE